jgi:hypothetical protein
VAELPWEYSLPRNDGTDVANVPSPMGAAMGADLARFCDVEEAKQLIQFPRILPRCNECAYRLGTMPNQCLATVCDAFKCAVEGEPFFCHKGLREGDEPKRLCAGWVVLSSSSVARRLVTR